jgi:pyridoxamine 5'-phosphate oxidase
VERVERDTARAYWDSRPLRSRLGAMASAQSSVIASRAALEQTFTELEQRYAGVNPPLPDQWGGFRVLPTEIEFWQGRESRLHDRVHFARDGQQWHVTRLSP